MATKGSKLNTETRSKSSARKASFKKKIEYKLTPNEMWDCIKGTSQNWGIEGYEVPRKYFDHHQAKWHKERKALLDKHKRQWPPLDWPKSKEDDKPVPPHRKNFIDDYIKWAKSFNDDKKAEERRKELEETRGTYKMPEPKKPQNLFEKFKEDEQKKKQHFEEIPKIQEWKVASIEKAKENYEEWKKKIVPQVQKDKQRYTKDKPQWARCDRVTVVADAEYVGETLPFYYTYKKEGEEDKAKEFYPDKKPTWHKDPEWKFMFKQPSKFPNDNMISRDEQYKEKIENLKSQKNINDKDLQIDVVNSYNKVKNRGKYTFQYRKNIFNKEEEHYKASKTDCPSYSPGPEHYWKMKDIDSNSLPKALVEETEINGKPGKIYYMNHKRTDWRVYKPMRKSVY